MDALLAFAATLLALRLSADLLRRHRQHPTPGLLAWAAALAAFAAGSGAIAWGSAYAWSNPAFRVYYLCGGLLAAALLGAGSLAAGRRPLGGSAHARLRRARNRDRDRGAADRSGHRQLDPGGTGAPCRLPRAGRRDPRQLGGNTRRSRRRRDGPAAAPARERARPRRARRRCGRKCARRPREGGVVTVHGRRRRPALRGLRHSPSCIFAGARCPRDRLEPGPAGAAP